MKRSTYEQPLPQSLSDNAATPYGGDGKPVAGGAHTYPEMAAAGLWTTPTDLARYAIEVEQSLSGKANHVLSAEMTQQMLRAGVGHGDWALRSAEQRRIRTFLTAGRTRDFDASLSLMRKMARVQW